MTPIEILNVHVAESIRRALLGQSHLDPEVLKVNGFATATMRHLFSNLCHLDDLSYLEVGTFCGATFCAAFNNNPIHAAGIDNFSQEFDQQQVMQQLRDNLNRWKGSSRDVQFYNGDCFALPPLSLRDVHAHRPFDIYYYDGYHSEESQARALPAFFQVLADRFIFIVDDFNWEMVSKGTQIGFDVLRPYLKIENEWHLSGGDTSRSDDPIWWNGVAIYTCSKLLA